MRFILPKCIGVLLGVLLTLSLCSSVRGQGSQIEALADQMAGALSHSTQKMVVVFDFFGADQPEAVGQKLADEFSVALAKSGYDFQVQDRSHMLDMLRKNSLAPDSIRDSDTASWFLKETDAGAVILGTMSNGLGGLGLSVEAYRVSDSYPIASFETSVPFTADLKAVAGENEEDEFATLPRSGKNGYSTPTCAYCPSPQYSTEASKHGAKGAVVMEFTVDEEGHTKDIRVKLAMPYGLTQQAIQAVQAWRLKPAIGPDGKPAEVRQEATVTFNLTQHRANVAL